MPRLSGGTNILAAQFTWVRPLTATHPPPGLSRPAMQRRVVLLPHPLGPSSVNSVPLGTEKDIPFTAASSWSSPGNLFASASTRRYGVPAAVPVGVIAILTIYTEGGRAQSGRLWLTPRQAFPCACASLRGCASRAA